MTENVSVYPNIGHNSVGGVWADCILHIIGWFQFTDVLNPSSGNYVPESGPNGVPVSGPGWVAYEKPGANPGDIVIIYRLQTVLTQGSISNQGQLGSVLWELLDPAGLCYHTNQYSLKSCVSPTDLVTMFPHPGGPLSPINPDNPNGDPDILWKRVTTQYQLPGPGNSNAPWLIRQVMPDFGIRILVWTPECCVHHLMTTVPPVPPVMPTPVTPPPPSPPPPGTPVPPPSIPGPGLAPVPGLLYPGNIEEGSSFSPTPGQPTAISYTGASPLTGEPRDNLNPSIKPGSDRRPIDPVEPGIYKTSVRGKAIHRPGSSPIPRPGSPQGTFYNISKASALPWLNKVGENDFSTITRARPVGSRFLHIKEGGRNPSLMKSHISWVYTLDRATLEALGLAGSVPTQGARRQVGSEKVSPTPGGKGNTTSAKPMHQPLVTDPTKSPSAISDPVKRHGLVDGQPILETTVGGYSTSVRSVEDVTKEGSEKLRPNNVGGQKISVTRKAQILSYKLQKQTEKGDQLLDQAGKLGHASLRRRTIDISRARQATRAGQAQSAALKKSGPLVSDLRKSRDVASFQKIEDPNGQFKIVPISYRGGEEWSFITLVLGDVASEKHVILNQTAMLYTDDGVITANLGSSGIMQFGRVNPISPGMYVVANPSCIPGHGGLPNIIAGGNSWQFMTLVLTLINLESQIIAQETMNFLPTFGGDTDVVAPNRLPFGLMRDLEMSQSSNFLYDGTYSARSTNQNTWYEKEPSIIVERSGSITESVAIVLKATVTSQGQNSPFRPLLEIYNDTVLQASGPASAFIGGPCSAPMGWIDQTTSQPYTSGGVHTACPGSSGKGGAGGTSAYIVSPLGVIQTGPYNPGVYAGTHNCFLYFRYDPANSSSSDSNYIEASGTKYRIRVYNNGPVSDTNGFALYTQGLKISGVSGSLTINSDGEVEGTLITYHCAQILRIRNDNTGQEVERLSSWQDGSISLGSDTILSSRLSGSIGDVIKIYRPGYDNAYNSGQVIAQFTVA